MNPADGTVCFAWVPVKDGHYRIDFVSDVYIMLGATRLAKQI
jgi:hypothetical protein